MNKKLGSRDFILVVIGQIISLFGNATIRFALPLYLLNQTGSSVLYGTVTACAFIPAILLSPVGGILADRVNKRNIMVTLDFFTSAVILMFYLLMDRGNLILLLAVTLMVLYGIAGAYQPSVQASIPALVDQGHFMAANSIINIISSLSALLGPALGGVLYSAYGLKPVLWICVGCFFASAVMELFIRIPFVKQPSQGSVLQMAKKDFRESIAFIRKERPVIGEGVAAVCGINLFLSGMMIVGMPYLITEVLPFPAAKANMLYGFAQGVMAAGGLFGGMLAGVLAKRLSLRKAGNFIILCALCVFPMAAGLISPSLAAVNYVLIIACCFIIMACSTIFTIQMMAFVQTETPQRMVGKVIAVVITVAMCAQPLGNALYGALFDLCDGFEFAVVLFSGVTSLIVAFYMKKKLAVGVMPCEA